MSNARSKQERPIPLMLVLLLLAAIVLSNVLNYAIPYVTYRLIPSINWQMAFISLVHYAISFPFWLTCIVWLSARSGRTALSTWIVPIVMLAVLFAAPMLGWLVMVLGTSGVSSNLGDMLYMQWSTSLRTCLFEFVLMAFAFRATTLHLRPVDTAASPHRLTVLFILLMTTIVAISLSVDALAYKLIRPIAYNVYVNSVYSNSIGIVTAFCYPLMNALLWFSVAWLFVARNPMRWFGASGLAAYLILIGAYFLLLLPTLMNQRSVPPGVRMPTFGPYYFLGSFAVSVFHIAVVFLCVGMMHLAGYRWDIRRKLSERAENAEIASSEIPPLLGSRK